MGKYFSKPGTYGRLTDALLSLGFKKYHRSPWEDDEGTPHAAATVYKHDEAGAAAMMPVFASGAKLRSIDQDAAASAVYRFGVLTSKEEFNAMITEPAQPRPAPKAAAPKRERAEATAA